MADETIDADSVIAHQYQLLDFVQKQLTNFKKDSAVRKTKSYFERRLSCLDKFYSDFHTNHRLIMPVIDKKEDYIKEDIPNQFEEAFLYSTAEIEEAYVLAFPPSTQSLSSRRPSSMLTHTEPSNVRLPKLDLPKFSGNILEWPSFFDSFKQIHDNLTLSSSQKFQYLKGCLQGEAELKLRHLAITDNNYTNAIDELEKNYNNKRLLFAQQMNAFLSQPEIKRDTREEIQQLLSFSRASMHVISKLGVESSEAIFVHIVLQKLHQDTRTFCLQSFDAKKIPLWCNLEHAIEIRLASLPLNITSDVKKPSSNSNASLSSLKEASKWNKATPSSSNRKPNSFHVSNSTSAQCPHCKESHILRKCPSFLKLSVQERKVIVEKLKYCFNCLGFNHVLPSCPSQKNCATCGGRHHTLLHFVKSNDCSAASSSAPVVPAQVPICHHATKPTNRCRQILLATAIVRIRSNNGQLIPFRALVDQGSQATLITKSAAQRLGLPMSSIRAQVNGIGSSQTTQSKASVSIAIRSCHDDRFECHTNALILDKLTKKLPSYSVDFTEWDHIQGLPLADPHFSQPGHIDLLLGAEVYASILRSGLCRGKIGTPIAQYTSLGWILSGEIIQTQSATIHVSSFHSQIEIDSLLRKFWEIEEIKTEKTLSKEDKWCEEFFQKTHERQSNGKYLVQLPLKSHYDSNAVIGSSYKMAYDRFLQLERRFHRDPSFHSAYSAIINEYFELGQMELETAPESDYKTIKNNVSSFQCCYLPHHPVFKATSSTTKLRVVFDASATTSNKHSLNDILLTGPALQSDLPAVIINWRFFKYVFTSDIEKMYRRIDMYPQHTQYQRILWRDSPDENIKTYRLKTVTFGTASAPYTAIRVMHQLAQDEENNFPLAAFAIKNQMYVDDILSGSHTIDSTIELQQQIIQCLQAAGFELRKWSSNASQVLSLIPLEYRESKSDFLVGQNDSIKALGMYWHPLNDEFHYKINFDLETENHTKRTVLSTIARLFDPLGWINPVIIVAKTFLKRLWCEGLDWDDQLPHNLAQIWKSFLESLNSINQIKIPRWIHTDNRQQTFELHTFCDGSMHAYSAATYLRIETFHRVFVHLVFAKCKVTPKRALTIPRIELCGAVLATKLHRYVKSILQIPSNQITSYFWTDSTIVLSWIRGDPNRWKTFVCNRVNTILDTSNINQWHHVSTTDNPADISSRGLNAGQLINCELWWHGPQWLKENASKRPESFFHSLDSIEKDSDSEMKKSYITASITIDPLKCITRRYSSYIRLRKITAWILRFINNCREKRINHRITSGYLTLIEWNQCVIPLHTIVQLEAFPIEIAALKHQQLLPTKSKLIGLNPFMDRDGILRVGGRLRNSLLPFDQKHPVIIPSTHHFTRLLIDHCHRICLHGGIQLTLNQIRKTYWILHARRIVGSQLKNCHECFKVNPIPRSQLMGDLPHARVRPTFPFSATGVDYAGPIAFRVSKGRGNKSYKGYIAVFVCLSTKAMHLEPVSDLTTSAFLAALQRFFARRGFCQNMYSDCGTTFIGANNQLKVNEKATKKLFEKEILPVLIPQGIQWHFIPPFSPHFGGLWEAGVKSVKYHLKRIIPKSTLTFEEMATVLCRIESCLNSRPLFPLSDKLDDITALTPGHFIRGDALLAPPPEPPIENLSPVNRWHQLQKILHEFWNVWHKEYLSRLQIRPKWNQVKENIAIGELVLVKDERLPPNHWRLGRVIEVHEGKDKLVRVASLKTANGIIKRPIVKLCPLPCQEPADKSVTDQLQSIKERLLHTNQN